MQWANIKLIFRREIRDQLRDRRTMFMIVVLPVLLYPALGLGMVQLTLRFGQEQRTVAVVGADRLEGAPAPLLDRERNRFAADLFRSPAAAAALELKFLDDWSPEDLHAKRYDAALVLPRNAGSLLKDGEQVPIRVIYNGIDDDSLIAHRAIVSILERWQDRLLAERMKQLGRSPSFAAPLAIDEHDSDVSTAQQRSGTAWGKIVPFILVMMALTGAFYPAIDLCAGEKERGTMETLLITPASRGEIVLGKFLCVFSFSVATTIFNLVSMGLTFDQLASAIRSQVQSSAEAFAAPGPAAIFWMLVLMLPLAGFFAALCMALAVFARSSKEGQYYLMPVLLVVTPLVFLTLAPGVELNPFYSLVPVTNVALLLRTLLLNEYEKAMVYLVPVMAPTVLYGYLALRYAVEQFNREEVLFREAEPFNLRLWVRQLLRDKEPTPTAGEAWFCYVLMLLLLWYSQGRLPPTLGAVAVQQLAMIGFPAVLLSLLLTSSPRRTLALRTPAWRPALLAVLLVPALHPVAATWGERIKDLMPPSEAMTRALEDLLGDAGPLERFLVLALVPAVCEELAFRGFILAGLLRKHPPGRAILISAVLFGVFHMVPQQMVVASILGVVLAMTATRTGSVYPGMLLHALHNGAMVWHAERGGGGYATIWVAAGCLAAALLFGYLAALPSRLPERRARPR